MSERHGAAGFLTGQFQPLRNGPGCRQVVLQAEKWGGGGWGGERMLIKHLLAGQPGSRYSEPQRTVHILLLEGMCCIKGCLKLESSG